MATLNMVEFPTLDSVRVDTLRASRRGRRLEAEGYRPVGLTIGRSVSRLFVCLSVCLFVCLSLGLPIRRSACLLVCVLSVCPCVCLFVFVSVCPSVCLCLCLCLRICLYSFCFRAVYAASCCVDSIFPRRLGCVVSSMQRFFAPCSLRSVSAPCRLRRAV